MLRTPPSANGDSGFTLVELMVATALGVIVLFGIVKLFGTLLAVDTASLKAAHLEQQLGATMELMTDELRRAGYWSGSALHPSQANRFGHLALPQDGCILYDYDQQADDPDGRPDTDDHGGFKLQGGAVRMKTSDGACRGGGCADCATGNWWAVTDPQTVRITGLVIQVRGAVPAGARNRTRHVEITLSGEIAADPQVHRTLNGAVAIANGEPL